LNYRKTNQGFKQKLFQEYLEIIKDLIEDETILEMDNYRQHGQVSTLVHSIYVSYSAFKIAKKLKLDYVSVARAGLLHDFYLYDWRKVKYEGTTHRKMHPKIALEKSKAKFTINQKEEDIILKHMFPVVLRTIPKYKESLLVSLVDKYCAIMEVLSPKKKYKLRSFHLKIQRQQALLFQ
jgi:uncharacterized protein